MSSRIGATSPNNAAYSASQASTAAKWPTQRWSDASHALHGLNKRVAELNQQADDVRRVDPARVQEMIATHLAALELQRQYEAVQVLPNNVLLYGRDLPPGPQREEVTRRAVEFEDANARLSEAIDKLEDALKGAMTDTLNPEYTIEGVARVHPNQAISDLRSYLRTGQPPASLGGPAAPRPPMGTGDVIPQLQVLQDQLKVADGDFIELATEKLPRLAVFAAGTNGARPEQVQGLDAQFKRAAQMRGQLPRLEDVSNPLSDEALTILKARMGDYSVAVSGVWARERTLREDMLNQAHYETRAHPFGHEKATRALDALAQWAARHAPQQGSTDGSESLNFTRRAYAVNQALRDTPIDHGPAVAEQLWLMDITQRALMGNHELKQRCEEGERVRNARADPVCNVIDSDLRLLELEAALRSRPHPGEPGLPRP